MQLFRVHKIQPENGYESIRLTLMPHADDWYTDAWGISADPDAAANKRDKLARPSFPWAPYLIQPLSGDPMYPRSEWTFRIQSIPADDGTYTNLLCTGRIPVNSFSTIQSPVVQRQGTMAAGGSLLGGGWAYYWTVVAEDADGFVTPPGETCETLAYAPGTFTATIPILFWDADTVNYHVFGGFSPTTMTWQATGAGTPASIDVAALLDMTWGVPDGEFDGVRVNAKTLTYPGAFTAACTAIGTRTITIPGCGVGVDWGDRIISLVGKASPGSEIPLLNFEIDSNTDDVLTIKGTSPDPDAQGCVAGDVFVMRMQGTVTGQTLEDLLLVNPLLNSGGGLPALGNGALLRVIAGTGCGYRYAIATNTGTTITIADSWAQTPDATSVFVIEDSAWLPDVAWRDGVNNYAYDAEVDLSLPVRNVGGAVLLVMGFTYDGNGNMPPEQLCPFREVYVSQNISDSINLDLDGFRLYDGTVI